MFPKEFFEKKKVNFEKKSADNNSIDNYQACKELTRSMEGLAQDVAVNTEYMIFQSGFLNKSLIAILANIVPCVCVYSHVVRH